MDKTREKEVLNELEGAVYGEGTKARINFVDNCLKFYDEEPFDPHKYIVACYEKYSKGTHDNSENGNFFEDIICSILVKEGIGPFFKEAEFAFIPDIKYDIVLYCNGEKRKEKVRPYPIVLSLKTTARERYKQADLEALALKNVHRKAETYLLVNNENDCIKINNKIKAEDILALKKCIYVKDEKNFGELLEILKKKRFIKPKKVDVITTSKKK